MLFVLLGHFVNEVNILNKTFMLCSQFDEQFQWATQSHSSQALVFAKLLTGKLYEGWELLGKTYFATAIGSIYGAEMNDEAAEALRQLKQYFGRSNIIKVIRHAFSFHYSPEDVRTALEEPLSADQMVAYLGETNGNTLYYFSEYLMNKAVLKAIDKDEGVALDRLMDESSKVVAWFSSFAQGVMAVFVDKYLLDQNGKMKLEAFDIGPIPKAGDVVIPYYFRITTSDGDAPLK